MRTIAGYVENETNMAAEGCSVAWTFDLDMWGVCGQGATEAAAVSALADVTNAEVVVAERVHGDEQAFPRDYRPATAAERDRTIAILAEVRPQTVAFVESCPPELLDWDDPQRVLPAFARWRTIRAMAWHIADTESRYYLPSIGLPRLQRGIDLGAELRASFDHIRHAVETMPADLVVTDRGEIWTTTKVLRRLAWHERGELVAMQDLAARHRIDHRTGQ